MEASYYPIVALLLTKGATARDCFRLPSDADLAFSLFRTEQGRRDLSYLLRKPLGEVDWKSFGEQIGKIERRGFGAMTFFDACFPGFLRDIAETPAVLFYRGDKRRLERRGLAMVGSRTSSVRGAAYTRSLAEEIAVRGITVVSGAARGIDTAAHRGALNAEGATVAVLGTGLDVPYPPGNSGLLDEISESGCVISEQLFGTPPMKYVFPQRNRLISGLAHAVVVMEARERSGALITARWALEQGREVGAVPGFPGDPHCRGSNRLIKSGAFPVENADDILEAVPALAAQARAAPSGGDNIGSARASDAGAQCPALPEGAGSVLEALSTTAVDVDTLARHLGLAAGTALALLLELELRGLVERDAAGGYHRISCR